MNTVEAQPFFHGLQQLAKAEEADDGDQEADALDEFRIAKSQAHVAGDAVHADRGKGKAEHHRDDGLERRGAAHADEAGKGQEINGEILRRTEFQGKAGHPTGEQGDHDNAEQRACTGGHEGQGQRVRGFTFLGQWIAVEGRGHRRRFAGDVEQDRRRRAAKQRTPVHAGEQDDGGNRIHGEGQGQEQRYPVGRAQAGEHTDQNAQHHPTCHQHQVIERKCNVEAMHQVGKIFQGLSSSDFVSRGSSECPAGLQAALSGAAPGTRNRKSGKTRRPCRC